VFEIQVKSEMTPKVLVNLDQIQATYTRSKERTVWTSHYSYTMLLDPLQILFFSTIVSVAIINIKFTVSDLIFKDLVVQWPF